jgi:hypothetical protein
MNPGQLRLTVDLDFDKKRVFYMYGGEYQGVPDSCYTIEAEKVWNVSKKLADSLLKQTRVKKLFFHFRWPFEEHKEGIPRDRGMLLEKMVMGESYDGIKQGKNERRHWWNGYQCGWDEECSECS